MKAGASVILRAAEAPDDAPLRALARETPLSGAVRVVMEREPAYAAGDLLTTRTDTVVGDRGGVVIGCGSRVLRSGWWNGRIEPLAYLSGLRVHPDHQRRVGGCLRKGFDWMQRVASAHPAAGTWTAIFSENTEALAALCGARAGLPRYLDRGRLSCRFLPARRRGRQASDSGLLRTARREDLPAMIDLRDRWITGRPLAMPLEAAFFESPAGAPALRPEDFLLLYVGDTLRGMIGVWDVRAARQIRVLQTPWWWQWVRLPARLAARVNGWPNLPAPGEILAIGYASFFSLRDDDRAGAAALLDAACRAAGGRGLGFVCLCLHESDPLADLVDRGPGISSDGRLFEVVAAGEDSHWPAGVPVVEPALL